jgi:hypothetical protein
VKVIGTPVGLIRTAFETYPTPGGRPAAPSRSRELDATALRDHRLALAGLAADNELGVEADMRYSRTGEGMHRFTDPAGGEAHVYTQCGPDEAPRVFACFDQPDLKAVLEVSVAAPAHWTVLSNRAGERRCSRPMPRRRRPYAPPRRASPATISPRRSGGCSTTNWTTSAARSGSAPPDRKPTPPLDCAP